MDSSKAAVVVDLVSKDNRKAKAKADTVPVVQAVVAQAAVDSIQTIHLALAAALDIHPVDRMFLARFNNNMHQTEVISIKTKSLHSNINNKYNKINRFSSL